MIRHTHIYIYIYIYIYIIIMCHQDEYPRLSLVTPPYRSSLVAGLQGYIPYPHNIYIYIYIYIYSAI